MKYRVEKDFLGDRQISNDCYYGIQTLRAVENFHITGNPISQYPHMVRALAAVKMAAAKANCELGVLEPHIAEAIIAAGEEIRNDNYHEQFVVDQIQGGAGTSTNMNANEVMANLALEQLGYTKGKYDIVHPNNHVNCSQSTNDVYPTAFRLALMSLVEELLEALDRLQDAFSERGAAFKDVLKMGRTQLQDAVPMSLGDEFESWGATVREDMRQLENSLDLLCEVNLGATAIGTRVNAPDGYAPMAVDALCEITGRPLRLAENLIEATWDTGAYVQLSAVLKRIAIKVSKICNDLRLLSSGPRAGLNEINLPRMQPGSSIMPGKVNPVIPEVVNQVCFLVIGNDVTLSFASEAGQLQLNVMEPVMAHTLFQSIKVMTRAFSTLESKCVRGITANREQAYDHVHNSVGIVTYLSPVLGYEVCSEVAKEVMATGKTVREVVLERQLIPEEKLDKILSTENLTNPTYIS